jgi:hypothetical protein
LWSRLTKNEARQAMVHCLAPTREEAVPTYTHDPSIRPGNSRDEPHGDQTSCAFLIRVFGA